MSEILCQMAKCIEHLKMKSLKSTKENYSRIVKVPYTHFNDCITII